VPERSRSGLSLPSPGSRRAVVVGAGRFGRAAVAVAAMVASRFVVGALLLPVAGVDVAVAASVVSESVLALVLVLPARHGGAHARTLEIGWANGGYSAATSVGLWLLIGADVLLARHLFPGVMAGEYAAAATLARIAMYLPQSVSAVYVPSFADRDGVEALRALRRAVGYAAGLGAVGAAVLTPGLLSRKSDVRATRRAGTRTARLRRRRPTR